jgi:methionyl-tRNA synthetase
LTDTFYITTPIYYVNGTPHIGHAYTTIAADTAAEYMRMIGRRVRFVTGTDEHGQKVLEAAVARGLTPKAHCDDMVVRWKAMMERLEVRYDRFIRTTDADHERVVTAVLQRLYDAGEIYRDTYTGWYSTAAERFWTEKDLVDGKCPDTGQPVQEITETNYFFRMGKYRDRLIAHLEACPESVQPASRRNEVLGFLRQELGDLCISRPKSRMSWGIPMPFDDDYVTYVWFDALLNYATAAGYHPEDGAPDWTDWWPASVHLIGKDILTTHSVYWTTMLMALGLELPETIYAHGWWIAGDGQKMSKSLGNAIEVDLLVDSFGLDATRYFFLREIAFGADGSFTYEGFLSRYNVDLANDLGNLAHRGLSMTTKWLGGVVPPDAAPGAPELALRELASETVRRFDAEMKGLQFNRALGAVMDLVGAGNKYIDTEQPWSLNRDGETARLQSVKRHVLELCYIAATLLLPVMPNKCAELLEKLGRTPDDARAYLTELLACDGPVPLAGLVEGTPVILGEQLFPRFREMPAPIAALLAAAPAEAAEVSEAPVSKRAQKRAEKKKKRAGPPPPPERIEFADFAKVALKVGHVVSAEPHPDATKLLVLQVDVGEAAPRQIVAGIRSKFTPEAVVGRKVVVVANLAPVTLRGVESQGMLLAAGGTEVIDLVAVDAPPGEVVR